MNNINSIKKNSYLLAQIICLLCINIYLFLRIRWDIFDLYCPTFLLNLLDKISENRLVIDHLGIPNIPFNYHFFSLYLASIFKNIGFSSISALTILIVISFNLCFFALIVYSLDLKKLLKKNLFLLPFFIIINLFSSSGYSLLNNYQFSYFSYLSVAEYFLSISWPISFLILSCQFLILKKFIKEDRLPHQNSQKISSRKKIYLLSALTIIPLPFINPTAFIVSSISHITFYFIKFIIPRSDLKFKISIRSIILFLTLNLPIIISYILSKYIFISTLYSSDLYDKTFISLGIYSFKGILHFLIILTPTFYLSILTLNKKVFNPGNISLPLIFSLISFIVPFLIHFEQINLWDNIHKFALLASFSSIFLLIDNLIYLDHQIKSKRKINFIQTLIKKFFKTIFPIRSIKRIKRINFELVITSFIFMILFLSGPSIYSQFTNRLSFSNQIDRSYIAFKEKSKMLRESISINDKSLLNRKILFIPQWDQFICDEFMSIASMDPDFYVLGGYEASSNFLLSKRIENLNRRLLKNKEDYKLIKENYPKYKVIYVYKSTQERESNQKFVKPKKLDYLNKVNQYLLYELN